MRSKSSPYRTIKALVFDYVHRHKGCLNYPDLTDKIKTHFPDSRWAESHWAWYRHQIIRGRFKQLFSSRERTELAKAGSTKVERTTLASRRILAGTSTPRRRPHPVDAEVKRKGDPILNRVRLAVSSAAGQDADLKFRLNRWVFSRLQQDEIRAKRPIKRELWDRGVRACQACNQPFHSLKGVELHRKNEMLGYSVDNCELLCRECHQELR